jgi:outer membrane protein assembly factor BamB
MPQTMTWRPHGRFSFHAVVTGALVFVLAGCFASQSADDSSRYGEGTDDEFSGERERDDGVETPGERREREALEYLNADDPNSKQPSSYYAAQLAELPLRIKYYDLTGNERRQPVIIREMHLIQDDVRDEILVVDADRGLNHLWSIDAYDFTLHWKTVLERRVDYDPLPTRNYIHFMNRDGLYHAYDRLSSPREGESRLVSQGRFEGDIFPSAHPASNDTHLFVPATNSNAIRGLSMISNARGEGAEAWTFPRVGSPITEKFMQIARRPAADRETVAFVNNNNYLYMIDAQSGEYRASPYLEAHSRTQPLIKDDLIFAGSDIGQLFAWQKSGEAAWVLTVDGLPYGEIFVEDRWVFVRTLEVYDREVASDDGKGTRLRADVRPGKLSAYRYELIDIENDRPVYNLIDGDPKTAWTIDPMWSEDDVGQQVLMVHKDRVYVLYEEREEFLTESEKAKLRDQGRIVRREDESRVISRELRVLDIKTGNLLRPEWNLNLMDFDFVRGSMQERDRAIYLGTRDGYVFKIYGDNKGAGGGR